MVIFAPVFQLVIYGYAISTTIANIDTSVYDLDRTQESRELISTITASRYFRFKYLVANFRSLDELINRGSVTAAVVIPTGFAKDLSRGTAAQVQVIVDGSDPNTATTTAARPVVRLTSPDGAVPDGMTVDAAGTLWVACWGGGCVQQFSATGKPLRTFALPAVQISSVAFGGTELCDLLVTSAATGLSGIQDGGIFLLSPGASGRAEFRARL